MKARGLSLTAIGFGILVIAIDFAVIRAAFVSGGPVGWERPGARLYPHMLGAQFLSPHVPEWPVFVYYLLPMIDVLLIRIYPWRRRGDDAGSAGYIVAGSGATLGVFIACSLSPKMAVGMVTPISRRIALASVQCLAALFGKAWLPSFPMEWTYVVIFAILVPMALFCMAPLLAAIMGGWVSRQLRPRQRAVGAGVRETATSVSITPA